MLANENAQLKETVTGLERERDFYFSKLRDIELLVQQAMEANPALESDDGSLEKQIQNILYSTEVKAETIHDVTINSIQTETLQEGFEIPEAEGEPTAGGEELETF